MLIRSEERELARYTAVKSAGLSLTQAQKHFGFQNMTNRVAKVEREI